MTTEKPILYNHLNEPVEYEAIKYDWIEASKAGVKGHPQLDVARLGMNVYEYVPYGIGDCSIMLVDKVPEIVPEYISLFPLDEGMVKYLGLK